jgi:hypothetical protein
MLLVDAQEFKQYYLHFWRGVLRRGIDAALLRQAFFAASSSSSASASSMLELPTAQFLHTLRTFSGGRLSDAALAAIGATADRNRDGSVDVDEFIELLAQTDATRLVNQHGEEWTRTGSIRSLMLRNQSYQWGFGAGSVPI